MSHGRRTGGRIAGAIAVLTTAFAIAGCDGLIHVRGSVHELVLASPDAESRAFIDEPPPMTDLVQPVAGARVVVYFGGDYSQVPVDETTIWQEETVTDAEGRFELHGICDWRPFHAALRVEKPGYRRVLAVFPRGDPANTAVVLLVLEPGD